MTTTETVADVLAEIRTRPYGRLSRAQIHSLADRIESALASAEPVAFDPPCKMVATLLTWMLGKWENGTPVTEEQARDILAKIFAHAQPAAKVEAQGMDSGIDSPHFKAIAWFDTFNAHVYFDRDEAQRAHDGGNTVLPIESMAAPTPASVPDGWAPTDEQYRAWCETHDMQESVSREAFDDAASLYLLEPTP